MTPRESLIKTVKGMLAGDGNLYDRMNVEQGGIGLPNWVSELVKDCKKLGVNYVDIEKEATTGKAKTLFDEAMLKIDKL
jgi:hypothetical protein